MNFPLLSLSPSPREGAKKASGPEIWAADEMCPYTRGVLDQFDSILAV